jgi:hypothetical protein
MKKLLLPILAVILVNFARAQNANWGTGVPMTINQNGSSIELQVQDPVYGNKTNSFTGDDFLYQGGIAVIIDYGNKITWVTYDVIQHSWKEDYESLSSSVNASNIIVQLNDGVVAFLDPGDKIKYATYDLRLHTWKEDYESVSSSNNSLNCEIVTNDGVVVFIDAGDKIKYAVYNAKDQTWESDYESISSSNDNANCEIMTSDGIVLFTDAGDKIKYAVYNVNYRNWVTDYESISSSNDRFNCNLYCHNGVVLFSDYNDKIKYAAFDPDGSSWSTDYASISGSPTSMALDGKGTVTFTKSGSNYQYGFTSSGSWSSGSTTALQCRFYSTNSNNDAPMTTYFWCNSVGASSYTINTDAGHSIDRRWGWKTYEQSGSYSPYLTIYNSSSNSTCNTSVDVTGIGNELSESWVKVYPTLLSVGNAEVKVKSETVIVSVRISNTLGQEIQKRAVSGLEFSVPLKTTAAGVYLMELLTNDNKRVVKRLSVVE